MKTQPLAQPLLSCCFSARVSDLPSVLCHQCSSIHPTNPGGGNLHIKLQNGLCSALNQRLSWSEVDSKSDLMPHLRHKQPQLCRLTREEKECLWPGPASFAPSSFWWHRLGKWLAQSEKKWQKKRAQGWQFSSIDFKANIVTRGARTIIKLTGWCQWGGRVVGESPPPGGWCLRIDCSFERRRQTDKQ